MLKFIYQAVDVGSFHGENESEAVRDLSIGQE